MIRQFIAVISLCFACLAGAHEVQLDECAWYGGMAGMIALAKNNGMSEVDLRPRLMSFIFSCVSKDADACPIKDQEDRQLIVGYARRVYEMTQSPIDADAVEAKITDECTIHAGVKATPEPMTPNPSVPYSGKQIEG
jgi:hypothetical protein